MTDIVAGLSRGEITVAGRLPWSSNYTFLVDMKHGEEELRAVYKPAEGEQPLRDFPPELYKREVAAYELANTLGWPHIPTTIVREDAPFGVGSMQLFIPANFEEHYFTLLPREEMRDALIDIAVFDVIANNADRKAGHCIFGDDGVIYAIDNGLCFHEDDKLRTVIWDFAGVAVPQRHLEDLKRLRNQVPDLGLAAAEQGALVDRIDALAKHPVLPIATSEYRFPWPLV